MTSAQVYRARRRRALGVVAALACLAGALVGAGGNGQDAPEPPASFCAAQATSMKRVAGQTVLVRMEDRANAELRRRARGGEIGGVALFPPPDVRGKRLSAELERLQTAAEAGGNPPLLVAIDQEGGAVERLPALPPQVSPFALAQNDDPRAARLEGRATGFQLRELGISVNLAPVLDVPATDDQFMTPRAFGTSPSQVSRLGLAFAAGLRREGVAATAKHFPGLGRAAENTDFAPTAIAASGVALERDIAPFREAVERGIDLIMVSSASYPALGSGDPASLSPAVVTGMLRDELNYDGVVVSDDLLAPAVGVDHPRREATVLAARAGVDLLLLAADEAPNVAADLVAAVEGGELDERSLRASCERIVALKNRLAAGEPLSD